MLGRNQDAFLRCLLCVGGDGSLVDEEGRHVELLWEVDSRFVLFLAVRALVLESLEVENEYFGGLVDLDDLLGHFMLLAVGTVPLVAPLQLLLLAEVVETVLEFNCSGASLFVVAAASLLLADVVVVLQVLRLEIPYSRL